MIKKRLVLGTILALALAAPLGAQGMNAQIQAFWNQLRVGALKFVTLSVQTSGYANFGNAAVGVNGYGIRDNAGTMQFKNSGGAWINIPGASGSSSFDSVCLNEASPDACITRPSAGVLQVSTSAAGTTLGQWIAALLTATVNSLATVSTDGALFQNTTPATVGATVQISPRSRWCGSAWNSVSVASEIDCAVGELLPATNAGATTSTWRLGFTIAGGAVSYPYTFTNAGLFSATRVMTGNNGWDTGGDGSTIRAINPVGNALQAVNVGTLQVSNNVAISGGSFPGTHMSVGSGMAVANVGANSCGTTTATIAGNNNAFVITVGTVAGTQCRVAFTFAATTEWDCAASDDTTTVAVRTTPVDTTHTDLIGTFTAGDKVTGICFPR